jgi:hypothetical protein
VAKEAEHKREKFLEYTGIIRRPGRLIAISEFQGRVADLLVPLGHGQLRGQDGGMVLIAFPRRSPKSPAARLLARVPWPSHPLPGHRRAPVVPANCVDSRPHAPRLRGR